MSRGFDDIVVGGGSAGCVVASRLASAGRSVLLLEAGPDLGADIPGPLRDGWGLPRGDGWPFDWGYAAEADAAGVAAPVRRGRVLGGTSWLTRFAVRGSPADFDGWAAQGLDGWSFDALLPAFRRIETDADFGDEPWHGSGGPLPIARYLDHRQAPDHEAAVEALEAAGFPHVDDHNRPGAVGVGRMPMSSRDGRRFSSLDSFVPSGSRPGSLALRGDSEVAAVVLRGSRAAGVRLVDGSVVESDRVILSAGVYGSPVILLRSGIGPAADLVEMGISVSVDLPGVGENLADHPGVELELAVAGPPRTTPFLHSIATWRSSGTDSAAAPDLLFWIGDPQGESPTMSFECVLLRPRSRGRVRLRSADPADPPMIELPGVSDPEDRRRLLEARQLAAEVARRPELASRAIPTSDEQARIDERWVAENAYSYPHTVGTCGMGTSPEAGAVVDARGRVHGVAGLHVVDASIMPGPPSGYPNLVTMAMAEHLATQLAAAPAE